MAPPNSEHTVSSAGERGICSILTGQPSCGNPSECKSPKNYSYLCDPKLLAFLRQLAATMPRMVIQVTGFISHQFHCKVGLAATAIFEGMARFERSCFGRWRRFMKLSLNAFVFCISCENRSDLNEYG